MQVSCKCNFCPGMLQFDDSQAGEVVICPHCEVETTLYAISRQTPPAETAGSQAAPRNAGTLTSLMAAGLGSGKANLQPSANSSDPWGYLQMRRKESCYKTLRTIMAIYFGIWYVLCGLFVVGGIAQIALPGAGKTVEILSIQVLCVAIVFIFGLIGVGLHQAALLAVDATDFLIDIGRKQTPRGAIPIGENLLARGN
jgi:hypothetical protein